MTTIRDRIFLATNTGDRAGGAVEGALRARNEGLLRGIGITGHGMRARHASRAPGASTSTPC
jgi:hypothetical protein